jgi:hypothetical protein
LKSFTSFQYKPPPGAWTSIPNLLEPRRYFSPKTRPFRLKQNRSNPGEVIMTLSNFLLSIFAVPLFFWWSIVEFRRSWQILKRNEKRYTLTVKIRFWLTEKLQGEEAYKDYKKQMDHNRNWTLEGYLAILYGVSSIGLCILFSFYIYKFVEYLSLHN